MSTTDKVVHFYVPGIRTIPGESRNWDGRAVTHTHLFSNARGEKIEYLTTALLRPFFQGRRTAKIIRTASFYAAWRKKFIGHSNGTDVILDAFDADPSLSCDEMHLVCAACEADCDKNGLNAALQDGRIGHLFIYVAGRDLALKLAARWFERTILGYGTLGLHGPKKLLATVSHMVTVIKAPPWTHYGHSECWSNQNFAATMAHFL